MTIYKLRLNAIAKVVLILLALVSLVLIINSAPAEALSRRLPENENIFDYGQAAFGDTGASVQQPDSHLVIARRGKGNGLEATTSWFKAYFPTNTGQLVLRNIGHCSGVEPDSNVIAKTTVEIYANVNTAPPNPDNARETPGGSILGSALLNTARCNHNVTFNLNLPASARSTQVGHNSQYVAFVRVFHAGSLTCDASEAGATYCTGGVNGFKANTPTTQARLGYWDWGFQATTQGDPSTTNRWAFAIQDRISAGSNLSDFVTEFSPDCNIDPSGADIWLKWFDDDWSTETNAAGNYTHSQNPNTSPNYRFTLREYDPGGTLVRTITRQMSVEGTGDDNFGEWRLVNVKPDHNYTWTWYDVLKTNGVQIYLPYDSYNVSQDCPPPPPVDNFIGADLSDCTQIKGWFGNSADPTDNSFDMRVVTRLASEDQAVANGDPRWIENTARATPASPGLPGDHGFYTAIPARDKSATEATFYKIVAYNNNQAAPSLLQIAPWTSLGTCLEEWDYDVTLRDAPESTDVRANEQFTIRSRVFNNGNGQGATHAHEIRVRDGSGWRTNAGNNIDIDSWMGINAPIVNDNGNQKRVRWQSRSPIAGGTSDPERRVVYQVKNAPYDGDEICFEGRVLPAGGISAPSLSTTDEEDTSWDMNDPDGIDGHPEDQVYDAEDCVTIYNRRFSLQDPNIVPDRDFVIPGGTIEFDITIYNDAPVPANGTGDRIGRVIPVSLTPVGGNITSGGTMSLQPGVLYGGSQGPHTVTMQVGNVAPGSNVCLRVGLGITSGYSDGDTSVDQGNASEQYCVVAAEQPFFQVENHDIWAGGIWDVGGACLSGTPIPGSDQGEIKSVETTIGGTPFGSWVEYAAYAIEQITDFGTQAASGAHGLAFANTDAPTSYGRVLGPGANAPPKCLHNYFDELWPASPTFAPNFNSMSNSNAGTIYLNVDSTYNNNASIKTQKTAVVDGDLYIRNNITYDNFSYSSANDAITGPSFAIVVRGNIYIDRSVTELNGLYIAQPRADGTGGIIDTCSNGQGSVVENLSMTVCNNRLTINGALISEYVHLRRTTGGVIRESQGGAGGGAEQIIFNPIMYMHPPLFQSVLGVSAQDFEFEQIKDLPPIF